MISRHGGHAGSVHKSTQNRTPAAHCHHACQSPRRSWRGFLPACCTSLGSMICASGTPASSRRTSITLKQVRARRCRYLYAARSGVVGVTQSPSPCTGRGQVTEAAALNGSRCHSCRDRRACHRLPRLHCQLPERSRPRRGAPPIKLGELTIR